jgi:acyl-CoA dehydrogenase
MVDFTLTDDQQRMREMAHDFAEGEIRPVAWQYDKDATWPRVERRSFWSRSRCCSW